MRSKGKILKLVTILPPSFSELLFIYKLLEFFKFKKQKNEMKKITINIVILNTFFI